MRIGVIEELGLLVLYIPRVHGQLEKITPFAPTPHGYGENYSPHVPRENPSRLLIIVKHVLGFYFLGPILL
jgi:hypothetical protein